jgi:RNA polymerase sigma factor (sigma-70 family)
MGHPSHVSEHHGLAAVLKVGAEKPGNWRPERPLTRMDRTRGERWSDTSDMARRAQAAPRAHAAGVQAGMTWPPALPFEQALRQAQAADKYAMGLLYRRFLPVVYRYTLARVGDAPTAEDITSETFFVVVARIAETRAHDELTFVAWALGIARNQIAMHFRRLRSRPTTQLLTAEAADIASAQPSDRDPLDVITARESLAEVVAALDRLTEEQRTVILYRCVLGYSADDVAQLLGKHSGAIRALQFRALASLARFLRLADGAPDEPSNATARRPHRNMGEE